jgi:hypothetical protein
MLFSAILLSVVVPLSISPNRSTELITKPYIVQAVIDSARIAGLPPSKAARAYAAKIQTPDPVFQQISYTPEPISSRKLFFRNYFSTSGT